MGGVGWWWCWLYVILVSAQSPSFSFFLVFFWDRGLEYFLQIMTNLFLFNVMSSSKIQIVDLS